MNRRQFLSRSAGLAGLNSVSLTSWLSLQGLARLAAQSPPPPNTYKALVCIYLIGGNDSFNMLVPRPDSSHDDDWNGADGSGTTGENAWKQYCSIRGGVNLATLYDGPLGEKVLPLYGPGNVLRPQALHGSMPRLQAIFNGQTNLTYGIDPAGHDAAFVANVGTMVQPATAAQVRNRAKMLPVHLQSHADQVTQWHSCFPQGQLNTGWAGRLIDRLYSGDAPDEHDYSLISLDGNNLALTGGLYQPFSDSNGSQIINSMISSSAYASRRTLLRNILSDQTTNTPANLLNQAYVRSVASGLDLNVTYASRMAVSPPTATGLPNLDTLHGLVDRMRRVAHIIKAFRDDALTNGSQPNRQIFFLTFGSWDQHSNLKDTHASNLRVLDSSIGEFYMLLKGMGALDDVTLFTGSDFGRGLVPNGDGTDHAWGGNHIVVGGAVNGGQIYGQYPALKVQGNSIASANADSTNLDIYGNGVLTPTLSTDQYLQRLGKWFLQSTSGSSWADSSGAMAEWSSILPNWGNLYDWHSSESGISGLMS